MRLKYQKALIVYVKLYYIIFDFIKNYVNNIYIHKYLQNKKHTLHKII